MEWIALCSRDPAFELPAKSALTERHAPAERDQLLPVVESVRAVECLVLLRRQNDVADPETHRRLGYSEASSDLVEREALFTSQLASHVPFGRFHTRKQPTEDVGRNRERATGLEPATSALEGPRSTN
jgi:hypothetical protein